MSYTCKPTALKLVDKLGIALRKDADARIERREAICQGGCDRTDSELAMAHARKLSGLVASRGYGRTIVCLDCLLAGLRSKGYWPSVHGAGQGKYDWRIEVVPVGDPASQSGLTVELWCADGWFPCQREDGQIAWRAAEPSIKWTKVADTWDFHGMVAQVTVWCRFKGDTNFVRRASFPYQGAEHMRKVLQACKL